MRLHLGVLDPMLEPNGQTTATVAQALEGDYLLFSNFYWANEQAIADTLADSVASALDTMLAGLPAQSSPFADGEAIIEQKFKDFLTNDEMAKLGVTGVPTIAAQQGRSSRRRAGGKHRKVKGTWRTVYGPPRPSFIDSGTLRASLKAWVEE